MNALGVVAVVAAVVEPLSPTQERLKGDLQSYQAQRPGQSVHVEGCRRVRAALVLLHRNTACTVQRSLSAANWSPRCAPAWAASAVRMVTMTCLSTAVGGRMMPGARRPRPCPAWGVKRTKRIVPWRNGRGGDCWEGQAFRPMRSVFLMAVCVQHVTLLHSSVMSACTHSAFQFGSSCACQFALFSGLTHVFSFVSFPLF